MSLILSSLFLGFSLRLRVRAAGFSTGLGTSSAALPAAGSAAALDFFSLDRLGATVGAGSASPFVGSLRFLPGLAAGFSFSSRRFSARRPACWDTRLSWHANVSDDFSFSTFALDVCNLLYTLELCSHAHPYHIPAFAPDDSAASLPSVPSSRTASGSWHLLATKQLYV